MAIGSLKSRVIRIVCNRRCILNLPESLSRRTRPYYLAHFRSRSSSAVVAVNEKEIHVVSAAKSSAKNDNIHIRENRWKNFTNSVLNNGGVIPITSITVPVIQETFNSIQFWLSVSKQERVSSSSKGSVALMVESVTKADHLLRVLLAANSKVKGYTSIISEKQLEDVVQSVLDHWRLIAWQTSCAADIKVKAAESAGKLLALLEEDGPMKIIPVKSYNTVLDAYAKAGQIDHVEALLRRMISSQHNKSDNVTVGTTKRVAAPNAVSYNTCIGAWSHADKFLSGELDPLKRRKYLVKAAQASENWLRKMEVDPSANVIPNTITYTAVMNAWSHAAAASTIMRKSNESKATPYYVEQLFEEMCHAYKTKLNPHAKPNATAIGTVISAWAHSPQIKEAPERAEALLRQMEELYMQSFDESLRPKTMHYNMVLHLLSNSGKIDSARNAERMLHRMEQRFCGEEPFAVEPDVHSYNTVLNAFAKSKEPGSAQRAERLLEDMIIKYEVHGRKRLKPDTISFTTVIDAFSKDNSNRQQNARKAEALLWRVLSVGDASLRPNVKTFTAVINAYARDASIESSQRAEALLKSMQERFNVAPNIVTYNAVLSSFAKCGLAEKAEELLQHIILEKKLRVDKRSFNACIEAWAKKRLPVSADKAESFLTQMNDLYKRGGYDEIEPDLITYQTVLGAICISGDDNCGRRAEALLQQMIASPLSAGAPKPDIICYNIVLKAWSHSSTFNSPESAERLLRLMCQRYEGRSGPKPDVISFNSTLFSWAKSKRPDKIKRTIQLFQEVKDPSSIFGRLKVKPDLITYSTVINAFNSVSLTVSNDDKMEIVSCLQEILEIVDGSIEKKPDSDFYCALLKMCCNRYLNISHLASQIFEKCCSAGCVSHRTLHYFKISDSESYNKIIGSKTILDLPKPWVCNNQP
jgi:pentatricopeptide repeat protein